MRGCAGQFFQLYVAEFDRLVVVLEGVFDFVFSGLYAQVNTATADGNSLHIAVGFQKSLEKYGCSYAVTKTVEDLKIDSLTFVNHSKKIAVGFLCVNGAKHRT